MKLNNLYIAGIFTLIVGLTIGWYPTAVYYINLNKKNVIYRDTCRCDSTPKLTEKSLFLAIKLQGIKHPDCVYKQAIWETGHLTSVLCKTKHNLFGFCTSEGYLAFNNWLESVKYYKQWQDKRYRGGDYFQFLDSIRYAEELNLHNQNKNHTNKKMKKKFKIFTEHQHSGMELC